MNMGRRLIPQKSVIREPSPDQEVVPANRGRHPRSWRLAFVLFSVVIVLFPIEMLLFLFFFFLFLFLFLPLRQPFSVVGQGPAEWL
jgi:hypothetical protein